MLGFDTNNEMDLNVVDKEYFASDKEDIRYETITFVLSVNLSTIKVSGKVYFIPE